MKRFFLFCFIYLSFPLLAHVLGLGAPCIDYIIQIEENATKWREIDALTAARIIAEASNPLIFTGDSVSNTIKGLASLGVSCSLTGFIGDDPNGEQFQKIFNSIGVTTLFTKTAIPTSQVICYVTPDGERTFSAFVEAERQMTRKSLKAEHFAGATLVLSSGCYLPRESYLEASFELAKKAGSLISFDLANAALVSQYRERLWSILPAYVDILFANEEEAFALVQLPPKEAAVFLKNFCKIAVVKVGEQGCWVCSNEGLFHSPGIPTQAADTTGAGDLFASGFLYGYLKGEPLKRCAELGNLVGSAVVEQFGAEIASERWPQILQIFSRSNSNSGKCCIQTNPSL